MAKIGIFGGTFDPIHNGHLVAAKAVANQLKLDKVLFVPTGNSWQKSAGTPAEIRSEMVALAISDEPLFELSRVDVDREGPTYTIDTLRELAISHPGDELWFILGTDAMANLKTWKDYEKLFGLANFAVVTRPGFAVHLPAGFESKIRVLEIPALDISATEVRTKIEAGQSISDLVPVEVANYIGTHKTYEVKA